MTTQALLQQAKAACPQLAWLGSEEKNRAILQMADAIEANADVILAANAEDLHAAQDLCDGGRVCAEHANVRLILYLHDGHLLTKKVSAKRV